MPELSYIFHPQAYPVSSIPLLRTWYFLHLRNMGTKKFSLSSLLSYKENNITSVWDTIESGGVYDTGATK
jgi:hypothetical protein